MLQLYMDAQYKSHDNATLSYMEHPLRRFHTFNDVFLLGESGKKAKANANALRMDLMNKWRIDKETKAETWMLSKQQREINAWQEYISHKIDVSMEFNAGFTVPKIPLMPHWVEQILSYGALQQ